MAVHFTAGDGYPSFRMATCNEAAEVCATVRDTELERVSGYADRLEEMVIEKDREATQWAERLYKAEAAIGRVRRLCDLTIAASCRVQAIDQARDTLAALDREES